MPTNISSPQGYLGQCLSRQCGVSVVGLERESVHVASASRRAEGQRREIEARSQASAIPKGVHISER